MTYSLSSNDTHLIQTPKPFPPPPFSPPIPFPQIKAKIQFIQISLKILTSYFCIINSVQDTYFLCICLFQFINCIFLIYLTLTDIFIVMMPFMLCLFINPPVRAFHKNTKLHIRTCPLYKRMDSSPRRVENMSKYIYQEQIRQILI